MNAKESIYNYDYEMLLDYLKEKGEPSFRAEQIFEWLYEQRVEDFDAMSNLSKKLRSSLKEDFVINTLSLKEYQVSKDETTKFLLECSDGALIETVLMRQPYGYSVCLTTQVGCAMGCKFCASGLLKKKRNLFTSEMMNQILFAQRYLDQKGERVSHIVMMGIGEPFDNYRYVMRFLKMVNDEKTLNIGARHITISTSGIAPVIKRFADEESQINLAISLHAPNNELRSSIMPVNDMFPLEELFESLQYYQAKTNRRLTFEYIMIKDVNDHEKEALELIALIRDYDLDAWVNLIPYNEVSENSFKQSTSSSIQAFKKILKDHGIEVTAREEKGADIDAACGQLRAKAEDARLKRGRNKRK